MPSRSQMVSGRDVRVLNQPLGELGVVLAQGWQPPAGLSSITGGPEAGLFHRPQEEHPQCTQIARRSARSGDVGPWENLRTALLATRLPSHRFFIRQCLDFHGILLRRGDLRVSSKLRAAWSRVDVSCGCPVWIRSPMSHHAGRYTLNRQVGLQASFHRID